MCSLCMESKVVQMSKVSRSDKQGRYQADSEEDEDLDLVQILKGKAQVRMIKVEEETKPSKSQKGEKRKARREVAR